jgi:membrane protease YdiL (CAAX protease family)
MRRLNIVQNVIEKTSSQNKNQNKYYFEKLSNAEIAWHWFYLIPTSIVLGAMSFFYNAHVLMPAFWQLLTIKLIITSISTFFSDGSGYKEDIINMILNNPCMVTIEAPIIEEVLFRVIIQNTIFILLSFITPFNIALSGATAISALIFGLAHLGNFEKFDLHGMFTKVLTSTVSGLMLSQLKNTYGLPAAISLHMINNTFCVTISKLLQFFSHEPNDSPRNC